MANSASSALYNTTTVTANQMYISNASISANSIMSNAGQYVIKQPVTRFVPMKRAVHKDKATASHHIPVRSVDQAEEYNHAIPSLYYAENRYSDQEYELSFMLYRFEIHRETPCYYILATGQRISKTLNGRTWARTPQLAIKLALYRAQNYLTILTRRAHEVHSFIKATRPINAPGMRELQSFEQLAKNFTDTDDIPIHLLQPNSKKVGSIFEEDFL